MIRLATILLILISQVSFGQVYVLQNNKFLSLSAGYSLTTSLGEFGTQRHYFHDDFEKIQADKDAKVKANFLPRHAFGIDSKFGIKFNPHIYFALNLRYNRFGHHEKFVQYNEEEPVSWYDMNLNMDYLTTGGQLILFHPNNFQLNIGYGSGFNLWDRVKIRTEAGDEIEKDWLFFTEYYKSRRKVFLGTFTFGAGYTYRNIGIDLNYALTRNAFLTTDKDIKFISSSLCLTYYFVKNKDNNYMEKTEKEEE